MKIEKFEDLIAWQKARALTRDIYEVTRQGVFARDFGLSGQIQRASVSIMSNIAEGFERSRIGKFHQFLSMAKASCAEVRSQLYVAKDIGYLDEDTFGRLLEQSNEVSRIIGGLRSSVQRIRNTKPEF
ncbi:MAG: four helix bundle protein [candidate division Zixibacteria bacterium RBG_16_53_22]|nr:MAG: four helix bundle protein [candidate division Zixibacteria bacterium RBG_16_53_22]